MEWCHSNALSVLYANTQKGKNKNIFSESWEQQWGTFSRSTLGPLTHWPIILLEGWTCCESEKLFLLPCCLGLELLLPSWPPKIKNIYFSSHSPSAAHCIFFTCCTILCKPQSWLWCHENPSKSAGCQTLRPAGGRQQSSSYPLGTQTTTVRWRFQEGNNKLILAITFFFPAKWNWHLPKKLIKGT